MIYKVVIKRTGSEKDLGKLKSHLEYIGFRSKEHDERGSFFGPEKDNASYERFFDRVQRNKALKHPNAIKAHKLVFSLSKVDYDAYRASGKDYKDLVRQTLRDFEKKHGVKLDWIANVHRENDRSPHCHVVIKAVSDLKGERGYSRIKFTKDDFTAMRSDFEKHVDRDAVYRPLERECQPDHMKDMVKSTGKMFQAVLKEARRDAKREIQKAEREKTAKDNRHTIHRVDAEENRKKGDSKSERDER